jgi:hypothetical protein
MRIIPAIGASVGRKVFHSHPINDRERITGWRLVAIWTTGLAWSWAAVIGLGVGLGRLADFLATLHLP